MQRVAIAVWRGYVSTTLDFAGSLLVVDLEGRKEAATKVLRLAGDSLQSIASRLEEQGIDVVICGAISQWLGHRLEMRGMIVIPFVSGRVDDVIAAFAAGTLDDGRFLMAGCSAGARAAWRRRTGSGPASRP